MYMYVCMFQTYCAVWHTCFKCYCINIRLYVSNVLCSLAYIYIYVSNRIVLPSEGSFWESKLVPKSLPGGVQDGPGSSRDRPGPLRGAILRPIWTLKMDPRRAKQYDLKHICQTAQHVWNIQSYIYIYIYIYIYTVAFETFMPNCTVCLKHTSIHIHAQFYKSTYLHIDKSTHLQIYTSTNLPIYKSTMIHIYIYTIL